MTSGYYRSGTGRAAGVRSLFAAIARRYDLINDLQSLGLHRRWKRRLARAAVRPGGEFVLDLCCGTGDVVFALQPIGAKVVGVDFSLPMLAVAVARAGRQGANPERATPFLAADGLRLPFVAGSFEAVTISYGLRNLADLEAGLREIWRVLRPGGRLVALDFGKPRSRWWSTCYFAYLRLLVPTLGWCICGDAAAYRYILESLERYPGQRGLASLLERTGWSEVETEDLLGGAMGLNLAVKPCSFTPEADHPPSRSGISPSNTG